MLLLQGETDGLLEFSISIDDDNTTTYFEEVRQLYYRVRTTDSCTLLFLLVGGGWVGMLLFFFNLVRSVKNVNSHQCGNCLNTLPDGQPHTIFGGSRA